jgi:hypothetical protein
MSLSGSRLFDPNLNNRTTFGATGPAGPPGPPGPPGPGASPMTPFVEGTAFGETSVGRTLLGFGVDSGSNNVGLWGQSVGAAQEPSNSSSSITGFFDTLLDSAQMLNGIYLGQNGSLKNSNLSNSLFMQRNSIVENQVDWTQNLMMLYDFTANPLDSITRSIALMTGQFVTDSQFDRSLLIGDMTRMDGSGVNDALCIRTPGPVGTLTMADNTLYIGNGQLTKVMSPGEFLLETYSSYFFKTLRQDNTSGNIAYYDPVDGELTFGGLPTPYTLPVKQPTIIGGQYGINSSSNNSEVNGRNSFNNYAAGPVSLSGVTAIGNNLYQNSVPGTNNFTNSIFIGRSHQFTGANLIQNSLIAAQITGVATITGISECNMVVPRAASLSLNYAGGVTGANFFSSGTVTCLSDPLYSSVFSSGGTVNPGTANMVLCENQSGGSIVMSGQGNTLISSSSTAQTYNFPAGINNSTVIRSGANAIVPTAGTQLAVNHTSFLFPNISAGAASNVVYPVTFNQGTGLISHVISADLSRVLRRVGTTNASGQIVFSTGTITPLADSAISLTVRNASTTVAYTAQVIAIGLSSVTVQVFNPVTVVLASPSMTASGAGIIVHMNMSY